MIYSIFAVNIAVLVLYGSFAAVVLYSSRSRKSRVPASALLNALSVGFMVVFTLANLFACALVDIPD